MTTRDDIETRLLRAVAVEPSEDGLRWLDGRVANVAAGPVAVPRRGFSFPRLILRPVALLAAFVVLTGAVVAGIGLIERIVATVPGWQTAWDRAEVLGIRSTDAGVTLTLERAYADLNQVVVGISIEGLDAPPVATGEGNADHLLSWVTDLRGPNGWSPLPGPNPDGSVIDTNLSAFLITFGAPPAVAGSWELTVTSVGYGGAADGMVDGTWRFAFELPKPTGTVVSTDATDTVGPATLTVSELRVTPTAIAYRIALAVDGSSVAYWSHGTALTEVVRHAGITYDIADENLFEADPTENEYRTSSGSDEAAGAWQIQIPDLWYTSSDGRDVHLTGPWTLTVTVP